MNNCSYLLFIFCLFNRLSKNCTGTKNCRTFASAGEDKGQVLMLPGQRSRPRKRKAELTTTEGEREGESRNRNQPMKT